MEKSKSIYLIVIAVIILIFCFGAVMMKIINDNTECTVNPLVYGAKLFSDQGVPIVCTCEILLPNHADFSFNNESIEVISPNYKETWYMDSNWSLNIS